MIPSLPTRHHQGIFKSKYREKSYLSLKRLRFWSCSWRTWTAHGPSVTQDKQMTRTPRVQFVTIIIIIIITQTSPYKLIAAPPPPNMPLWKYSVSFNWTHPHISRKAWREDGHTEMWRWRDGGGRRRSEEKWKCCR